MAAKRKPSERTADKAPVNPADIAAARAASPRQYVTWTPTLVRAAQRQAESGQLEAAAACCAWLLTDSRIAGALSARVDQLLGTPVQFQSGDKADPERFVADLADDFSDAWPEEQLGQILRWGLLLGYAPARHAPDYGASGRILPRLTFWNPGAVNYDTNTGAWTGRDVNQATLAITPGDGEWAMFLPYGSDRPWASGLWYSLALLAVAKSYAVQDWAKASEKSALWVFESQITDRDGYPITTTKEQRQTLVEALDARGSDASVALPAGWGLKLLQAADSFRIYQEQIAMIDTAIAVLIRGGNLTTQVSQGSLAAATAQADTGDAAKQRSDSATLGTFLRTQSIAWWVEWNYGANLAAPWPAWVRKAPKVIPADTAAALNSLVSAGFEVDLDVLREDYGLDFLTSYERPAPPPPPFGGGSAPNDPAQDASDHSPSAIAHGHTVITAAAGSGSAAQDYLDRVQRDVVAQSPLAVTAYELLQTVNAATDPEDLKRRITEAYAGLDTERLAEVFERAFTLAELAGRYAVLHGA